MINLVTFSGCVFLYLTVHVDSLADWTLHYFNASNPHTKIVPPTYACLDALWRWRIQNKNLEK